LLSGLLAGSSLSEVIKYHTSGNLSRKKFCLIWLNIWRSMSTFLSTLAEFARSRTDLLDRERMGKKPALADEVMR
jgi:hypothetical protein